MKKYLVYHLYWNCNDNNKCLYDLHSLLLKHYKNVFTDVLVAISVDNKDISKQTEATKWVLDIFNDKKLTIKYIGNDVFRETTTFKNEVIDKIDDFDGPVFFAHNKGTTNLELHGLKSILMWICGLYYFSLNFMDEVDGFFFDGFGQNLFYGPFLMERNNDDFKSINTPVCPYLYNGTFYWINAPLLSEFVKNGVKTIAKVCNRFYAESFPSTIVSLECQREWYQSHKNIAIINFCLYNMKDNEWQELSNILGEPKFLDFSNEFIKKISK